MFGINDFTTFLLGTIFIVLLPGPNSLYVMSLASRHGVAMGYRGAAGIFLGDTLLMLLSVTGVASLMQATPALFMVVKYAGAAYLGWLGLTLLRAAWRKRLDSAHRPGHEAPADASRPLRTALLISLANPKSIFFFISFFIQFVSPDYPYPALSFLLLGVVVQICSQLYLSALILGGAHLAGTVRERPWLAMLGSGVVGLMFIGFAVRLAASSLSGGL